MDSETLVSSHCPTEASDLDHIARHPDSVGHDADRASGLDGVFIAPGEREAEAIEARITELWAHINAATYRFLMLVGEFDRNEGWARHGLLNCAQWLNWQCGIGPESAREKVRVARALEHLPKISAAFAHARVSYSKVRAITRVATPANEKDLLNIALHSTAAHVERLVRKYRRVRRREEADTVQAQHRDRYLYFTHDEDGSLIVHAKLPAEVGAVVRRALEAAVEQLEQDEQVEQVEPRAPEGPASCKASDPARPAVSAETASVGLPPDARLPVERSDPEDGTANTAPDDTAALFHADADRAAVVETGFVESDFVETTFAETDFTDSAFDHTASDHTAFNDTAFDDTAATGYGAFDTRPETEQEVPTFAMKRADALAAIASGFLSGASTLSAATADRYQVVVHIDQALLTDPAPGSTDPALELADQAPTTTAPARRAADGPHRCEIDDGPTLALDTVRRLACDSALVGIVEGEDGDPLSVGRKTRAIAPALKRALKSRDGGCRFPGCTHTRWTEGHHVKHWSDGGETKLTNLITLCKSHHRLVHEGGFGLSTTADGLFVFNRPDGSRIADGGQNGAGSEECFRGNTPAQNDDDTLERGGADSDGADSDGDDGGAAIDGSDDGRAVLSPLPLCALNRELGLDIDGQTIRSQWLGEPMDYSLAIEALLWEDSRPCEPAFE